MGLSSSPASSSCSPEEGSRFPGPLSLAACQWVAESWVEGHDGKAGPGNSRVLREPFRHCERGLGLEEHSPFHVWDSGLHPASRSVDCFLPLAKGERVSGWAAPGLTHVPLRCTEQARFQQAWTGSDWHRPVLRSSLEQRASREAHGSRRWRSAELQAPTPTGRGAGGLRERDASVSSRYQKFRGCGGGTL